MDVYTKDTTINDIHVYGYLHKDTTIKMTYMDIYTKVLSTVEAVPVMFMSNLFL